jgi:retron-type reverse transcriptase
MKRLGGLFPLICQPDNFRLAWYKAQQGKKPGKESLAFARNREHNLRRLLEEVADGAWQPGPFHRFTITDPKERLISAAPFADRVVHHAIMNILHPVFDARLISHSYACRVGKGTHAAVLRAFTCCRHERCFLKLDVRKYFDSISHDILYGLQERLFRDRLLLALLRRIIDSGPVRPAYGLPIGNLTSQYFANHYLSALDQRMVARGYAHTWIRYMDDMVAWYDEPSEGPALVDEIGQWLARERRLTLKPAIMAECSQGLPFLGFRILPDRILLAAKSKRRFRQRIRALDHAWKQGTLDEASLQRRTISLVAMTSLARARRFRNTVFHGSGLGEQPGQPRGQLEQQRIEPSVGESQQQQPGQPEQQPGLPPCPPPSPLAGQ